MPSLAEQHCIKQLRDLQRSLACLTRAWESSRLRRSFPQIWIWMASLKLATCDLAHFLDVFQSLSHLFESITHDALLKLFETEHPTVRA